MGKDWLREVRQSRTRVVTVAMMASGVSPVRSFIWRSMTMLALTMAILMGSLSGRPSVCWSR